MVCKGAWTRVSAPSTARLLVNNPVDWLSVRMQPSESLRQEGTVLLLRTVFRKYRYVSISLSNYCGSSARASFVTVCAK